MYRMRIFPNQNQVYNIMRIFNGQRFIRNKMCSIIRTSLVKSRNYKIPNINIDDIINENDWLKKIPRYLLYSTKLKLEEEIRRSLSKLSKFQLPKYHSFKANVTMSYINKSTKDYVKFDPSTNRVELPNLGYIDTLKLPINNISKFLIKNDLIYGITFNYVGYKITRNQDNKFYATLIYTYEDSFTEYKDFEFINKIFHKKYNIHDYENHVISIDLISSLHKGLLLRDSNNNKIELPNKVKRLFKFYCNIKKFSILKLRNPRIQKLIYRKIEQLRNVMIEFSRNVINHYLCEYDIIGISKIEISRSNKYKIIYDQFMNILQSLINCKNKSMIFKIDTNPSDIQDAVLMDLYNIRCGMCLY